MRLITPNRIILDTNILLDLFVFEDQGTETLLMLLETNALNPITSEEILAEFQEVISRPIFTQDSKDQERIYSKAKSLHQIEPIHSIQRAPFKCSDPDDQMFLDLAYSCKPCILLSKDKALLKLKSKARAHEILIFTSIDGV